jgi:hypothetical protein
MMSYLIRGVRGKLSGTRVPTPGGVAGNPVPVETNASMEMMAASSQSMVALLSRFQEGTESDRQKRESEKSILKTMWPTQRGLFTSLCTRQMNVEPSMTEFMLNLTASKTPQKAINLIQSETRDWEGTFSVGGFHRMLSNGFLLQDPNRANPGGYTIFMFHPKTAELGSKGGRGKTNCYASTWEWTSTRRPWISTQSRGSTPQRRLMTCEYNYKPRSTC